MEPSVCPAKEGRYSTVARIRVNALKGRDGMGLDVQPQKSVIRVVSGMFSSICASVPSILFGMAPTVLKSSPAEMDKSLMGLMVASAPLPPTGTATGVNLTAAPVGRSGQTLAVNVSLGTTSMVHYVCYASMDNNGTPSEEHAIAQPTTLGMATCVAKECTALEAESTTLSTIYVSVMVRSSGMDGIVW